MSEFDPERYPPFPSGLQTASMPTFSLKRLENDEEERDKLFQNCKERGFFYLSLEGSEAENLPILSEDMAKLADLIFKLPLEEKMKYRWKDGSIFGYKEIGRSVVDQYNNPDTNEIFNISKDNILSTEPLRPEPQLIIDQKQILTEYVESAHAVGMKIVDMLSQKLGLSTSVLQQLHRLSKASGDHIRLTRGPGRLSDAPEIQVPSHTDFGTVTLLFNWIGGLQIWSNSSRGGEQNVVEQASGEWLWVEPKKGHVIVNLGDAAVKFTGGICCAGRHRVVAAPGEQGQHPRYSVVYFVRPEDEAILQVLEAPGIPKQVEEEKKKYTAKEWIIRQVRGLGVETE